MTPSQTLVSVPGAAANARILRIVATAAGADVGLGFDRLDDLALAVDEACGELLGVAGTAALECTIVAGPSGLEVSVRGIGAAGDGWPPPDWGDSLQGIVLAGVTDAVETVVDGGVPTIRFTMSV